jgi:hypothetical protein
MTTFSWNIAMQQAAKSVGYRERSRAIFFEKQIK